LISSGVAFANITTSYRRTYIVRQVRNELIRLVEQGDQVFSARNGVTVAQIVPAVRTRPTRRPGSAKGKIRVTDGYDLVGSDPEILAMFEDVESGS
jgi:antitoxin (DNA-binding transcriptional repressor) of toxin-antitoxin stability system